MRYVMEKEDLTRRAMKPHRPGRAPPTERELLAIAKPLTTLDRQIAAIERQISKRALQIQDLKRTAALARDADIRVQVNEYKQEVGDMLKDAAADDQVDAVDDFEDAAREFAEGDKAAQDASDEAQRGADLDEGLADADADLLRVVAELRALDDASRAEHALLVAEAADRAAARAMSSLPVAPSLAPAHVHEDGAPCRCAAAAAQGGHSGADDR